MSNSCSVKISLFGGGRGSEKPPSISSEFHLQFYEKQKDCIQNFDQCCAHDPDLQHGSKSSPTNPTHLRRAGARTDQLNHPS